MIIALLSLILIAILFPKALRFLFALLFIGGIVALSEVHAADCQDIAAFQVSSEPGIKECFVSKRLSSGCKAVIHASMSKRIHECKKVMTEFRRARDCSGPIMKLPVGCESAYQD